MLLLTRESEGEVAAGELLAWLLQRPIRQRRSHAPRGPAKPVCSQQSRPGAFAHQQILQIASFTAHSGLIASAAILIPKDRIISLALQLATEDKALQRGRH
jgi:hypothetical protein